MKILILSLLLIPGFLWSAMASEFLIPSQFHSLPVQIILPLPNNRADFGTGVLLGLSNKLFLVTAAHVIFNPYSTNKYELNNSSAILSNYQFGTNSNKVSLMKINLQGLLDAGDIKRHPSHDIAVILISVTQSNVVEGAYTEWYYRKDLVSPLTDSQFNSFVADGLCRNFSDIIDGEEIYIFGYPAELFNTNFPSEIDFTYPLIRTGIISQRNTKTGKLILDTGVYGGNSGGPVIVVEHPAGGETYKLAGIVTQFVPVMTRINPQIGVTNSDLVYSGYSVAEPIDYALELMREF